MKNSLILLVLTITLLSSIHSQEFLQDTTKDIKVTKPGDPGDDTRIIDGFMAGIKLFPGVEDCFNGKDDTQMSNKLLVIYLDILKYDSEDYDFKLGDYLSTIGFNLITIRKRMSVYFKDTCPDMSEFDIMLKEMESVGSEPGRANQVLEHGFIYFEHIKTLVEDMRTYYDQFTNYDLGFRIGNFANQIYYWDFNVEGNMK